MIRPCGRRAEAYGKKVWTNHERKSAQARAFTESREYILPAFFDESVEVPGLLKTTGRIGLTNRKPEALRAASRLARQARFTS